MLSWDKLRAQCIACENCGLCATRRNVVFGVGNENADLMFIGESPGEQEDIKGEPFVGPSGHLLDDLMQAVGISRDEVYIANIIKCRPPQNRKPSMDEQEKCIGYLRMQVQLIKPQIIVCLGSVAACRIINPEFRITNEHGLWFDRKGVKLTSVYHPSALLRDPSKRPDTFADFIQIERIYRSI